MLEASRNKQQVATLCEFAVRTKAWEVVRLKRKAFVQQPLDILCEALGEPT